MGNLLIRDVEESVVQRLKAKAEINGTSLQHEASLALGRGVSLTGMERRALFEKFERDHGFAKIATSGADAVRAVREEMASVDDDRP